jgi:hypothetical protein
VVDHHPEGATAIKRTPAQQTLKRHAEMMILKEKRPVNPLADISGIQPYYFMSVVSQL